MHQLLQNVVVQSKREVKFCAIICIYQSCSCGRLLYKLQLFVYSALSTSESTFSVPPSYPSLRALFSTGCDGLGHITGLYAMHFAPSGCPLAHGKTPEECKSRRIALNHLRQKSLPAKPQTSPPKPLRKTPRTGQSSVGVTANSISETLLERMVLR